MDGIEPPFSILGAVHFPFWSPFPRLLWEPPQQIAMMLLASLISLVTLGRGLVQGSISIKFDQNFGYC
jgi:hypothetical protein